MRTLIICTLAVALLAVSCRKEEFQQVPHGEPVPYKDTARYDITTLLGMTPHTLFHAAWQKSHLSEELQAQGAGTRFTILAPDDAAMRAAGYDATAIAASTPEHLDSLLRFHVIPEQLDSVALSQLRGNIRCKSLLKDAVLMEELNDLGSNVTYPVPYTYKQYIILKADGSLLVNGKNAGKANTYKATNGLIWPVNQVLQRPSEGVLDFLQRDPRFSIFAALYSQTEAIWAEASFGWFERNTYGRLALYNGNTVRADAFFAPTDEAFRKAGFNSVEDVMQLNARSMPYLDWDYGEMRNGFVSDSLLAYHNWGRIYSPKGAFGEGNISAAVFYSNDLTNANLAGFDLNSSGGGYSTPYHMPLEFGTNSAGQVTVKVKGSSYAPAAIIEADINTYQGPVHVMDQLILSNKVQF